MESQYQYSEHHTRAPYEMIRQLQSPPMGSNYRFDSGMQPQQRNGAVMPAHQYSGSNGYSHGSQLPPLHSRNSSGGGHAYGPIPPQNRSQHTSPVTTQLPFAPQYQSQPPYSSGAPQFPNPAAALPHYSHSSYGFSNGSMPYHGEYAANSGMPDFRGLTTTAHGQPIPASMPPHGYSMSSTDDYPSRTHVVGAQGRRGILPSDEGRPPAVGPKAGNKGAVVPQKDQNGKFPCPHCNKTYLHAKHLKRHLLRHTGDRPYACVLCSDTFSRSDILKRHFQKCSIRRGNPTGATHLSNPSAYTKKQSNRKDSTDTGRPGTSGSESAASTRQSTTDVQPYEQSHGVHGEMGMTQMNGGSAMPAYGTNTMHSSPTTSPTAGRAPMGFYEGGSFHPQGYMDS